MIPKDLLKWWLDNQDEGPTLEYKERIYLETEGDKAQFVKDILSLANSGVKSHLVIGIQDGTKKLLGIEQSFKSEQLNEILKNKCDPALTVEYDEMNIHGFQIGVIEIQGYNPPYLVSVHDTYGGKLTDNPRKFTICRGTIYIRRHNQVEGACRADLERIYMAKLPHPYLEVEHKVISKKLKGNNSDVLINFTVRNLGNAPAYNVFLSIEFKNAISVKPLSDVWTDNTDVNHGIPSVCSVSGFPLIPQAFSTLDSLQIEIDKELKQIEAKITLAAINMLGILLKDPYKIAV
jgi:hypothetical protein